MAELKTKQTQASVKKHLDGIEDEQRRKDCRAVSKLMQAVTGEKPKMWGPAMVGFGSYHYRYESGREGDWFLTGFAARKQALTLYVSPGFAGYEGLMNKLGKHEIGKACIYVKRLEDLDLKVLEQLIARSVKHVAKTNA